MGGWLRTLGRQSLVGAASAESESATQKVHAVCQQTVINMDGAQGGGLNYVLKNFSFANQRFESEEEPKRKIACTLMANVLFLTT